MIPLFIIQKGLMKFPIKIINEVIKIAEFLKFLFFSTRVSFANFEIFLHGQVFNK